ncbi:MAG: IS30 family transposase [Candidatus Omnitrophica bacterium]|nr:IS30 family transposase [Candidatus Omnitrophota bacterium]
MNCYNSREVAKNPPRSPSTITREINKSVIDRKFYRAFFAQGRSNKILHQRHKNHNLDNNHALRKIVLFYLSKKWSPEQIAKMIVLLYPNDMDMRISHETIYSYVYILPRGELKRELAACLRRGHANRYNNKKELRDSGAIQNYLSIEERPKEVADRIVPEHLEGVLIIGGSHASAIGTLVERTTRMTFLVKLENRYARNVRKAFAKEFQYLPKGLRKTLTYDQGSEMAEHKIFTKETDISVYFAHPSSPWERGTNENTNGLLRQYFPKGTDFTKILKAQLKEVQDELNDRPRKTLEWHTSHEKFSELLR